MDADTALVLTCRENQTQKLYAVCPAASALGLMKGMTLAEARAIKPDLIVAAAEVGDDSRALEELARWLVRFTPLVATDGIDGLALDISGCDHLFGGEKAMLDTIASRLGAVGIHTRIALAETRAAAWALSHYHPHDRTISENQRTSRELIAPLSVNALRLDKASVQTLHRLGLKTVGSLQAIPRPSLARRFRGVPSREVTALLTRLDQLSGTRDDPITPLRPLLAWQVRQAFSEPVLELPRLETATAVLISDLCTALAKAEQGVRRLTLSAFRTDGTVQDVGIGTNHPNRDAAHLMRLMTEKLPVLEAQFGFDLLVLQAHEVAPLAPVQISDVRAKRLQSTTELLDRLAARLGPHSVARLKHRQSHIPERYQSLAPAREDALDWQSLHKGTAPRPIRLLPSPESIDVLAAVPEGAPMRFRWRRTEHRVTKAQGPERIACEWWVDPAELTRDYYQVEVEGGPRFWLFRRGLYEIPGVRPPEPDTGTEKPQWFLHGFFT